MRVDTEEARRPGSAATPIWHPPTGRSGAATWAPPRRSGAFRKTLIMLGIAFLLFGVPALVGMLVDEPVTEDNTATRPVQQRDLPSPKELRAPYAGSYFDAEGEELELRKNGSYYLEGYMQTGVLDWYVKPNGNIFVTTYHFSDWSGNVEVAGRTYEPRKGGMVLVRLRKNGEPFRGEYAERYVRGTK